MTWILFHMKDKGDNRKIFDDYFRDFGGENISDWSDEQIDNAVNKIKTQKHCVSILNTVAEFLPPPLRDMDEL